jgi:hypothetical protein
MGTLDDAIREHLELKRRLGTSDEEIERKQEEAFGKGSRPAPQAEEARPAEEASGPEVPRTEEPPASEEIFSAEQDLAAAEPATNGQHPEAAQDTQDHAVAPDPAGGFEEEIFEPDEVPPEESLDPELTVRDAREAGKPAPEPEDRWTGEPEPAEDVLEETPEFLEETPEQDRLWFEQRPPKDFDF